MIQTFVAICLAHFRKHKYSSQDASYIYVNLDLFYSNFDAWDRSAREGFNLAGFVGYDSVAHGVDGEVAAELGAGACTLGHANLTHDNLSGLYRLATKKLNAKSLAGTVVVVLTGTTCFNFTHLLIPNS